MLWLWWGSRDAVAANLPYFPQLETGWRHHTVAIDWPVNYTRAIENQLDVAHLPFVHRTTIGRGGRSFVEGPFVEADETGIRVWVTNRGGDGPARSMAELAAVAAQTAPGLSFLFPGVWMLDLGPRLKNVVFFTPIDEQRTRYYVRVCHRIGPRLLAWPFERLMAFSNRRILRQDLRIIATQAPRSGLDATGDRLVGADRAISQFRKLLARMIDRAS